MTMPVRKFGVAATVMGDHAAFIQQFRFIVAALCQQGRSLNVFHRG